MTLIALGLAYLWLLLTVQAVRRTLAVSRRWADQPFPSNSGDQALAPEPRPAGPDACCQPAVTAEWQPSALDSQFARMLETYNGDGVSGIALFKVNLTDVQNQQGCGAVLYRTLAGRA
jgi:hypothetical protein